MGFGMMSYYRSTIHTTVNRRPYCTISMFWILYTLSIRDIQKVNKDIWPWLIHILFYGKERYWKWMKGKLRCFGMWLKMLNCVETGIISGMNEIQFWYISLNGQKMQSLLNILYIWQKLTYDGCQKQIHHTYVHGIDRLL